MSQGDNSEVMRRMEQDIKDLIARRDIYALVCGYMRALDRLLPDLHLSVFHDDAEVDCGLFVGPAPDFVRFAQKFLGNLESSHHLIGQADIRVEGDKAHGEIYFIAFHRVKEMSQETDLFVSGRYIDRYEDRGAGWKIAKRREIVDWARSDPSSDMFLRENPSLNIGNRREFG
jgi:hypothetical protein